MTGFSVLKVNLELLPIKFHFFLFFASLAGVLPFLPLVAKRVGLNTVAVGIIYAIIPFTITVLKPVLGIIVDKSRRIIFVIEMLILGFLITYTVANYIPSITVDDKMEAKVICKDDLIRILVSEPCDSELSYNCSVYYSDCGNITNNKILCHSGNATFSSSITKVRNGSSANQTSSDSCEPADVEQCQMICQRRICEDYHVYTTWQFWLFLVLLVIGGVCNDAVISLSDAACYDMLQSQPNLYGQQRVWGTVGWGALSPLLGYLVDVASSGKATMDYSPVFYAMIIGMVIDIPVVWKFPVSMLKKSPDILKDVRKVLSDFRIDLYISAVFFIGALTALQWNYAFWYIEDLGGSKLLLGLTMTIECFVAECPMMFFSGWIISKIGHEATLSLSLGAYAVRFFTSSYITNPWYFLIVAVCHGLGYGLFYAGMTSFAKEASSPGTEATLQCILGATFSGFGQRMLVPSEDEGHSVDNSIAIGSLLFGYSYDKIGGKLTYRYAGILAAITCVIYCSLHIYVRRKIRKLEDYETDKNIRRFSAQWVDLGERKFQPK